MSGWDSDRLMELRALLRAADDATVMFTETEPGSATAYATAVVGIYLDRQVSHFVDAVAGSVRDYLSNYNADTVKLLPRRWFVETYASPYGATLYEAVHVGRNGVANALLKWGLDGCPPDAELPVEHHVVRYRAVLSDDGDVVLPRISPFVLAPEGEIMRAADYDLAGGMVLSPQVIAVRNHLNAQAEPPS